MTRSQRKLWIGLLIMAFLSPLGVYLPKLFHAEEAWGEWGTEAIEKMLGYVPEGMKKMADLWKAPIADYNFGGEGAALSTQLYSYVISELIGITIAAAVIYIISKLLVRKEKNNTQAIASFFLQIEECEGLGHQDTKRIFDKSGGAIDRNLFRIFQ
jgi:hypothetical protein